MDPEVVDTVDPADLAAALTARPEMAVQAGKTSVLLVTACTLRRDRLEAYGNTEPTSPYLDALAKAGVLVEHNIAQAPWTRPSMGALFTGRWPRALGLDNPGRAQHFTGVLGPEHTTLAERFSEAGYATVGAVANPNLKSMFGFHQGFEAYHEPEGRYKDKPELDGAVEIVDAAVRQLDAIRADRPFFVQINTIDTHKTRRFPPRYLALFQTGRTMLDNYDASLRHVDAQLARLHTELSERSSNLLVIIAADHGEGLKHPKHHGPEHGSHVWRTTTETPLVFFHPALPTPGRRLGGLSMNIDLVPTLVDLLGLPSTGTLDGLSLGPALRGETDRAPHDRAFTETFFRRIHKSATMTTEHLLMRHHHRTKGPARPPRDTLYAFDDWEANKPLKSGEVEARTQAREALNAWEATMDTLEAAAVVQPNAELDADTRAMLEDLGYLDGPAPDDENEPDEGKVAEEE